jgi:phage shock protein E
METLKEILKDNRVTLIDVRNPWEYESDHIPGAINIPLHEIPGRITELKEMTGPVIFYCQNGNNSRMAYTITRQTVLTDIYDGGNMKELRQMKMN